MRSRPTIPLTTISILRSLQIILCVATKIHRGTSAGIKSYRPMTTAGRDIVDNDIKIATRTCDNTADTMPENIPFGEDMYSGLRFGYWTAHNIYSNMVKLRLIMIGSRREADVLGNKYNWLNPTFNQSSVAIDGYNLAYPLGKCIHLFLRIPVGVAPLVASSQPQVDDTLKMDSCTMIQTYKRHTRKQV